MSSTSSGVALILRSILQERKLLEKKLQKEFERITGLSDFKVTLVPQYSAEIYGKYYIDSKHIYLFTKTVSGGDYPEEVIVREGIHELAHHIQYNHLPKLHHFSEHGYCFKKVFANLIKKYYNNLVPTRTKNYLVKEGKVYAKDFSTSP